MIEFANAVEQFLQEGTINYSTIYPDFPSGGIIINKKDLHTIYETGKGKIVLRAKTSIEGNSILIHELPYQVYAEPLIDSIKELVVKDEIKGIKDIYNKSDKKRILIEIECDGSPASVLNKLFSATDLQKTVSPNQYALVSKVPKLLNLKDYIQIYIDHNLNCIKREYEFELSKAKDKLEITEGLIKAIAFIDDIIKLIKQSDNVEKAKASLMVTYDFTERQAKAIVDMKLGKLAKLEGIELEKEAEQFKDTIQKCMAFLESKDLQNNEFLLRLKAFVKEFGWERRTQVTQIEIPKEEKEIAYVEPEKCVVIMTEGGLIKRIPAASFKTQKRNTKGAKTQDDITSCVIRTNTIDSLMVFTNKGQMYRLIVDAIPNGTNASKGVAIKSLIEMKDDEEPTIIYSIYRDTDAKYVIFVTKNGLVKKTDINEYIQTKRKTGVAAIKIKEGDELAAAFLVKDEDVILTTKGGYGIRFNSGEITPTGRTTSGVKGISLGTGDSVSGAAPIHDLNDDLAVFVESGLGKRISLKDLPTQKRGGKGVICYKTTDETGALAATALVSDEDNVLIVGNISSVCLSAKDIPSVGRTAIGNIMIKNNKVLSVSKV